VVALDDDEWVGGSLGAEGDAVGEVDLAAVGGVGEGAEGGAVFAYGEDPGVGCIEVLVLDAVAVGVLVPALGDVALRRSGPAI